jgi:type I restriction enzyme, S subunit
MSKIQILIDELCPEGIGFGNLGDFSEIYTGTQLNKTKMFDEGKYPVLNGGINPSGRYDEYNEDAETIAVSQGGASAGFVNFMREPFWAGAHCFIIKPIRKKVLNRFIYFILKQNQDKLMNAKLGAGIPGLKRGELKSLKIPIPPISVQEEIVKILDHFTYLDLELKNELKARKKQYNYYRQKLLNYDHLETKPIGDIVVNISSGKNKTKSKNGNYPVYGSTGIIGFSDSFNYTGKKILVARVGAYAGKVNRIDGEYDVSDNALIINLKENYDIDFMYYFLINENLNQYAKGGGQPLITGKQLKELKVPIIPLSEQERIVEILNKFDTLVNDKPNGLPAEIAARKKQYKYYREKLLTFKENIITA